METFQGQNFIELDFKLMLLLDYQLDFDFFGLRQY